MVLVIAVIFDKWTLIFRLESFATNIEDLLYSVGVN